MKLAREPLIYFFLLGAVIFGLHAVLNKDIKGDPRDPHLVEVTSADIEWLRSNWNRRMGREPTAEELQHLIDGYIREEILYREAVTIGLDKQDSIVRRRLAQKMEFLFKDLAEMNQPAEEELRAYFADRLEQYRRPAEIGFVHVYFSPDQRGERAAQDARDLLQEISALAQEPSDVSSLGDQFMLQSYYPRKSLDEIRRLFGGAFANALLSLEPGAWRGPLESSYGCHLVFVHDRIESRIPEFDEMRAKVKTDFLIDRRREVNQNAYNGISSRYEVLVEDIPYEPKSGPAE